MKVSVVIACFNGADFIANQLEALANQRYAGIGNGYPNFVLLILLTASQERMRVMLV